MFLIYWTSDNVTLSHQNLWAGNILKSMTSEGNNVHVETAVFKLSDLEGNTFKIVFHSNLNVSFGVASENIEILAKQNQLFQLLSV